ncbi:uncharacterized protein LOC142224777 [Haematobia irritans]|uniref:uncharacterized protein LOC142224777 n=1 Tax=Haematobia irritans TaxID=7368 RepID=UPI003F4FF57C
MNRINENEQEFWTTIQINLVWTQWTKCFGPARSNDNQTGGHLRYSIIYWMKLHWQLTVPNMEESAKYVRITCYPTIRIAMDAFDIKIDIDFAAIFKNTDSILNLHGDKMLKLYTFLQKKKQIKGREEQKLLETIQTNDIQNEITTSANNYLIVRKLKTKYALFFLQSKLRASRNVLKEIESNENAENVVPEDSYGPILQILRSDGITNEEFDIYWRKCALLRFQQIAKSKHNGEIYQQWPEYFFKSGINLINTDFSLKYPHAAHFKERWAQYSDKFAYVMRTKISQAHISNKLVNLTTLNTDSRDFSLLLYLHHLLPHQQRSKTDASGAKFRKRCTVVESQEVFAVVGASMEQIEAKFNVLKLQEKNIQPRLFMIGEINDVKSVSVYFDNNRYNFLSVLDAFDALFKIFFVFNFLKNLMYFTIFQVNSTFTF